MDGLLPWRTILSWQVCRGWANGFFLLGDHGDMEYMGVVGVNAVRHWGHFFLNSTPTEVHSAIGGRNMNFPFSQRMQTMMVCAMMLHYILFHRCDPEDPLHVETVGRGVEKGG